MSYTGDRIAPRRRKHYHGGALQGEWPHVDQNRLRPRRRRAGRHRRLRAGDHVLELLERRARRLGAEVLQQGLAVQDLGRRDGDGVDAGLDFGEVLLHRLGRGHRRADEQGDGQARVAALRGKGRDPELVLRRDRYYVTRVNVVDEIPLAPGVVVPTRPAEPAVPPAPAVAAPAPAVPAPAAPAAPVTPEKK